MKSAAGLAWIGAGVAVHGSVAAAGPSGLEGLPGGRSLDPPRMAVLVQGGVDELEVGMGLKLVGGLRMVWKLEMLKLDAK